MNIYCHQCYKPLGKITFDFFRKAFQGELVEGGRKVFCNEKCYQKYLSKYFVEEYKGNNIYWTFKNNKKYYIPYVGCRYGFDTIDGCKERIDANYVGIY